MKVVYEWIRSLVSFMLLMTMIINLLPDKKYEKYLRLFTGVVFLLLFFSPLTDLNGIETKMAGAFERITFRTDAQLLKKEIIDADGERMQQMISQYKLLLEQELRAMAETVGAECKQAEVIIESDPDHGSFGQLKQVTMVFYLDKDVESEKKRETNRRISELRTQIGEYYGVEEGNIAILVETK